MIIKTVTVIGANGTMGRNVSAIFASFGNAKVYMVSRNIEKSKEAKEIAGNSVKAECIKVNLIPKDYSHLQECLSESDLIFESVAEDFQIKADINAMISQYAKKDAIICTGTSGLSVTKLAECFDENIRKSYIGVHMFNPPYNMILCELISTKYTDSKMLDEIDNYLLATLRRAVVKLKDYPAFLGNRIGFQFINEAMQYAQKYKDFGGIDYIDALLGGFTGRAMAPIVTADFVGLDVHAAIVNNLYENTNDYAHDTFILPSYATTLISEGKLGRKTKGGLYKTQINEDNTKEYLVYDIVSNTYRKQTKYSFDFITQMIEKLQIGDYSAALNILINDSSQEAKICLEFMLKYIIYSLKSVLEVAYDFNAADDVMATGFNWCPPLALIDALGGKVKFKEISKNILDEKFINMVEFDSLCENIIPSKYDYRKFFKAKK